MKKNTQVTENDFRMTRVDQEWAGMNKKTLQSIGILVKSLDFDGFGRKFPKKSHVVEYFSPRVFLDEISSFLEQFRYHHFSKKNWSYRSRISAFFRPAHVHHPSFEAERSTLALCVWALQ